MVRCTLSFLIAFPYQINPEMIMLKKVKEKTSKQSKNPKVREAWYNFDQQYVKSDKNKKYICTINYKLMVTHEGTNITIVCWGDVAKIHLRQQTKAVRTIVRDNIAWVGFSVSHKVKPLKMVEVVALLTYQVEVSFSTDYNDLSEKYNEPEQLYYSFISNENNTEFEVLAPTNPNEVPLPPTLTKYEKAFKEPHSSKSGLRTLLYGIPCYLHRDQLKQKIYCAQIKLKERKLPLSIAAMQLEILKEKAKTELKTDTKNKKKLKDKDKKKKKKPRREEIYSNDVEKTSLDDDEDEEESIIFTGSEMIFDKVVRFKEKYVISAQILYAGIWLTTDTLLTTEARQHLLPIGISIEKLANMPVNDTVYQNCKSLILEYTLGTIIKNEEMDDIRLSEQPEPTVQVNNTQIFVTTNTPSQKYVETFQTDKLLIMIYGFIPVSLKIYGRIFTREENDKSFSRRYYNTTDLHLSNLSGQQYSETKSKINKSGMFQKQLLGYAIVDCNELIRGNYCINVNAPIMSIAMVKDHSNDINLDNFNTLEVYEDKNIVEGTLGSANLLKSRSYVKVTIKSLCSLKHKISNAMKHGDSLTRIFMIVKRGKRAVPVIKQILKHNRDLIGLKYLVPCIPFYKGDEIRGITTVTDLQKIKPLKKHINTVTGFAIDLGESQLIFVEGLPQVLVPLVWSRIFSLRTSQGSILYHDGLIFTERLYGNFLSIGGFYMITLAHSLNNIFSLSQAFIEGYIPNPAWRALISIKKLLMCQKMEQAVRQNLFPTCQELLCLDLEYGVPLYRIKN